ncbi:MAG TPA: aconitate hydratase [Candidatus Limnocylindria bacterium]|nr:aconitate hydratase [Candidatus Limnocylindria bacterium]
MSTRPLARRIIEEHLVGGRLEAGEEIALRIDQTLTQDATGTLADLQFGALGLETVRSELAVSYVDHNMLQTGPEGADDHRFLRSFAARHGMRFSRPGNGICHQVHLERFSEPGKTLLGADSHTTTCGGAGMLAIGAGGLDVALAMAGRPFSLAMPTVVAVTLTGRLRAWVTAKDVILELLRRVGAGGGVGKVFEFRGEGVATLSVPERATIANMGAELGATTSIFPSDERTRHFLEAQGRGAAYRPLAPDPGARYDEELVIALDALEPLIALPHSPDNVVSVRSVAGTPVQQVVIGSCTNSSYRDLQVAAEMLDGRTVHPDVSMCVAPGSRQAYLMAEAAGAIESFIEAGVRILESACGPCIGMGQSPASGAVSLRSFNRNFQGRSGTPDALVHLASVETCVAAAIAGTIRDPRDLGVAYPSVEAVPARYIVDDRALLAADRSLDVVRGPHVAPLPVFGPLADEPEGKILLVAGDDVSTDEILPAGPRTLPLRSNIPRISEFTFCRVDPTFAQRAREAGGGFIVAGANYGQGSSREHAAIAQRYLGIHAVIAASFARIHAANLVNFGVLPLVLADPADGARFSAGHRIRLERAREALAAGEPELSVLDHTSGTRIPVRHGLTPRQREIVLAGGLLNAARAEDASAADQPG